jgi:hypothetical protein
MLTFTVILAVAASIYILFPLFVPPSERLLAVAVLGDDAVSAMKTDKELYLKAIKDIDFEYASNKINEEDYNKLKMMYNKKAIEAMEKIEELESTEVEEKSDIDTSTKGAEDE